MCWSTELELLDQLLGGESMPLPVICGLFEDDAHARRVLAAYVSSGMVVLSDEESNLPTWKCHELFRNPQPLSGSAKLRVAIAAKGVKWLETGE